MGYLFWKGHKQGISFRHFNKKRKKYFYQELIWQKKSISTKKDIVTKKRKKPFLSETDQAKKI